MNAITFCTGNYEKLENAKKVGDKFGVTIEQALLEIDEIQSEDAEKIVLDKLSKAFAILQKPVVVTDDSWNIPALNGFPGPYMKSINHWFTPEDYLRLTIELKDRSINLVQWLGYADGTITKVFKHTTKGELLKEIKGQYGNANHKLVSIEGDNGLSVAEVYDKGVNNSERAVAVIWVEFMEWYLDEC